MYKLKKILNVFLSLVIALGCVPLTASAESGTEAELSIDNTAIVKLEAFDILSRPENAEVIVKRADMIPIMVECLNAENIVQNTEPTTPFLDVDVRDENIGAYTYLYNAGYVKGGDNRCFFPERALSIEEASAFIIRMYGYDILYAGESSVLSVASHMNLLDGVKADAAGRLTFADVYKMIYNALDADTIKHEGNGTVSIDSSKSILNDKYGIYDMKGIVEATEYTGLLNDTGKTSENQIQIDDTVFYCDKDEYNDLIGKKVHAFYADTDEGIYKIVYLEDYRNNTVKITAESLDSTDTTSSQIAYRATTGKNKYLKLENGAAVIYNGIAYSGYGSIDNVLPIDGHITLVDNDDDNEFEVVSITAWENYFVGYTEKNSKMVIDKNDNSKRPTFDSEKNNVVIYDAESEKEVAFDEIKSGDIITVAQSKNAEDKQIKIYISRKYIEGAVSSMITKGNRRIYVIDGTEYSLAHSMQSYSEPKIGAQMKFYIDVNGKIAAVETSVGSNDYKFAVVTGFYDDPNEDTAYIKLFTQDGSWLRAPLSKKVRIDGKKRNASTEFSAIDDVIIKDHDVIRYKYSGEEITDIDTEYNNNGLNTIDDQTQGDLTLISAGDAIWQRYNMATGAKVTGINSDGTPAISADGTSWFVKQNSIYVFKVPDGVGDEEKYAVEKTLDKNIYQPQAKGSQVMLNNGYKAYVTSVNDINVAECILLKGCDATTAVDYTAKYYLVSGVGAEALDESGEPCKILTLSVNGTDKDYYIDPENFKKITYYYDEASTPSNDRHYKAEEVSYDSMGIVRGDVVQIATDGNQTITGICRVYKSVGEPKQYEGESVWDANFHWEESSASGQLVAVDTVNKIVKFSCANKIARKGKTVQGSTVYMYPESIEYQSYASGANIVIYDKTNDTISSGTLESLIPGDTMIMRMLFADSIKDIIVIRG